jgi:hypothetical protein
MRLSFVFIWGASAAVFLSAHAADLSGDPSGLWKPFPAIFKIHSGVAADRALPTAKDRKLTVNVDGAAAREIFESIGPDVQPTCNGGQGDRDRRRKGIYCTYDPADTKSEQGPYRCWIGVNLVSGEAENNVSC